MKHAALRAELERERSHGAALEDQARYLRGRIARYEVAAAASRDLFVLLVAAQSPLSPEIAAAAAKFKATAAAADDVLGS